ncbi:MAG: alpha-1,4-glucan--maltose-1-phosphate maltosyltransferase [Herpetosiphonaceae bacterium]|nr:alpha-1,4-glucan--maltose-1-phosphate maltosyltransferase [Herpetosiphonaceae bacterium]
MLTEEGRKRVVIEGVEPEIDCGRFPIKRRVGEQVVVEADAFTDGHDAVSCVLLYRQGSESEWAEVPMEQLVNDRWRGSFVVSLVGPAQYTVQAWVDRFKSWHRDFVKRVEANQDLTVDLQIGAGFVEDAAQRAPAPDRNTLQAAATTLRGGGAEAIRQALSPELTLLMYRHAERYFARTYHRELGIVVDRVKARFSAWYELFPRSWSPEPGRHGTFKDVEQQLPYVASMGFDVLYFPPLSPIGQSFRKGPNNTTVAGPADPGSPWAIGSAEGGHTAIHPELGTLADFHHLLATAGQYGLELAGDIAFQCAPDHPYVTEHPEWFRHRPDGTIQYAENPPKKYQDIYPFDFETEDWQALWQELKSIILFWIEQGVRIFRVDNPHTKPFAFWEWLIGEIRRDYPETIFLAEAFTRPKLMYRLAKLGFSQSYNYFPWRNTKAELIEYFTELTQTEVREFFGANLWPNTPDILPESVQFGGRPNFVARLILAATLGASYGIYGPAYELCDNTPLASGKEEYLHSEKFEIKRWDRDHPDSLKNLIARVNTIRRENAALQSYQNLHFHHIDNDQLIAYTKTTDDLANIILTVVNLDPHYTQAAMLDLPLDAFGLDPRQPYQAHDLLTDTRYLWHGTRNYVELNPHTVPAHIFAIRRRVHTEQDFDYYL